MSTLLDITEDLRALDDLLYEVEGDVSDPKVAEAVDAWFAELDSALETKADNYAAFITELLNRAELRSSEAQRLYHRARIDQSTAGWLKDRLKAALEERNVKKLETPRYRISVAGNGGKQPVDIHDPEAVPRDLCKHVPEHYEPDSDLIRERLADGAEVPGAVLQNRGTHLRIK